VKDDAQVVKLLVQKVYVIHDALTEPGVTARVEPIDDNPPMNLFAKEMP
jgi:hypothetical protein